MDAIEINIKNARAHDDGFGLRVDGVSLEDIISNALGTMHGTGANTRTNVDFDCNSCDIHVTITAREPKYYTANGSNKVNNPKELMEVLYAKTDAAKRENERGADEEEKACQENGDNSEGV